MKASPQSQCRCGSGLRASLAILALCFSIRLFAGEVIPPAPTRYFNDYANVVTANVAAQLNQALETFEKEGSSQILVAVFPKMQSDSSIEDYTVRVARAWKAGQQNVNNGVVLFVFIQNRKMYIQVGYGLEGKLPDALCKRIIEDEIKPHFKSGDYSAGLTAGVQSLIEAARGEYKGTGRTVEERRRRNSSSLGGLAVTLIIIAFLIIIVLSRGGRRRSRWGGGWIIGGGGGGWSGGGGGGGWSGGGGGFSGGGGSFGGGGAGGSW